MAWVWYASGAVVASGGLALLAWSLLWDRSRGRRRCPRCWYDIADTSDRYPVVCPECGRSMSGSRQLHRTRRRWRWACAAVILCLIGAAAAVAPIAMRDGWTKYAPTTALILAFPGAGQASDEVVVELDRRLSINDYGRVEGESLGLWDWQEAMLARRCAAILRNTASQQEMRWRALSLLETLGARAKAALAELIAILEGGDDREVWSAIAVVQAMGDEGRPAIPALTALVASEGALEAWHTASAVEALGAFGPAAREAVAPLRALLQRDATGYGDEEVMLEAVRAVGRIGADAAAALDDLIDLAVDAPPRLRVRCIEAVGQIDPLHLRARTLILDGLRDAEVHMRTAAADITRRHPELLGPSLELLSAALAGEAGADRLTACRSLATLGADSAPARRELEAASMDQNRTIRLFAIEALSHLVKSDEAARARLESLTGDADGVVARAAQRALDP